MVDQRFFEELLTKLYLFKLKVMTCYFVVQNLKNVKCKSKKVQTSTMFICIKYITFENYDV